MIYTIVGARPNFMKAAPIHRAFRAAGVAHELVHTGQHYDAAMSKVFFDDLGMPRPIVDLNVGSGTHAQQTGGIMTGLESFFGEKSPRAVIVVGDVNSTMAAAIVAAKMRITCVHVEAGLRSGDWTMPEEINRVVTDTLADLLLTPSPQADANLLAEGCAPETIVRVGNVMIDTLMDQLPRARAIDIAGRFGVEPGKFAVLTLHRPSNVDDATTLRRILDAVCDIATKVPVVFPVHPRTRKQAEALGYDLAGSAGLKPCDPLGYLDFLALTSRAKLILTDSGGIQEESTVLGIPCITLRERTERPITVSEGTNVLVGTDPVAIRHEANRALSQTPRPARAPDLWDGKTAGRIVDAVMARLT